MGAFDGLCRRIQHLFASGHIAGQRNHIDAGMVDQITANGLAAPGDHRNHAFGQFIRHDLRHFQRRQRGLFRWFEHHGIAAANRRGQFPRHHHQGIIPRRNRGDHPNRIAADHRRMPSQIFTRQRAGLTAHGPGKKAVAIDDGRNFVIAGKGDRLAAVQRL